MEKRLGKTVAGRVANECVAVRLRMLNRVVTGVYDRALWPFRIKISQMNILVALSLMGRARPGDICHALEIEASTLSRNLDRLEKRGWVARQPDADPRAQWVRLTRQGEHMLAEVLSAWEEAQAEAVHLLGEEGVRAIDTMVDRVKRTAEPT